MIFLKYLVMIQYIFPSALFGVVFTDCVEDLQEYGSDIDGETIGKMMKAYVMDMTISDIQCECLCSPSMASAARKSRRTSKPVLV